MAENKGNRSDTTYRMDIKRKETKNEKIAEEVSFEDALVLTGFGKYNYRLLVISIYTLLACVAEVFSVGIIVTSSQCDLDLDVFEKGIISSVPVLAVIISAHFWGYLADTKGRVYTLNICIIGTVVGAFLSSFVNHWAFMTFTKFISAIFASGTNAGVYTLLGESTMLEQRSRFLLYATTGIMFSQGVITTFPTLKLKFAPYIPFLGYYYRPWRLLNQVIALVIGISFILIRKYTFESPKFYFSRGDHELGLNVLRKIYAVNTGESEDKYAIKNVVLNEDGNKTKHTNFFRSVWSQTTPLFRRKYIKNTLLIFGISIPTYSVSPPFSVWLPLIFNSYVTSTEPGATFCQIFQTNSTSNNTASANVQCDDTISDFTFAGIASFATLITFVSVLSIFLVRYMGKKWMYVGFHVLSAILSLVINHVSLLWSFPIFIGMMCNVVCMGVTTSYAVELFPTYMRATAVGLSMMVARAVSFIFFNIIGVQLLTNCSNFFIYLSLFLLSGAILGVFLPSDRSIATTHEVSKPDTNISTEQT